MVSDNWISVDRSGLAAQLDRKGRSWVLFELLQNAFDTDGAKKVEATLEPLNRGTALLRVADDDPVGFQDLSLAHRMFAASPKLKNPTKRGLFCVGEKLVLALCKSAKVSSTTGTVCFNGDGTRTFQARRCTARGTVFEAEIRMTLEQIKECEAQLGLLIPPRDRETFFNGRRLPYRQFIDSFQAKLETVIETGKSERLTTVEIYEVKEGSEAYLYELGIPVVPTGDTYSYNVLQRVPINWDRNNVPPKFLRTIRTEVLNRTFRKLSPEQATATWVKEALGSPNVNDDAVVDVVKKRFGDKAVVYDPSDKEAGERAAGAGFTVVPGRSMSAEEWASVKRAGALPPAGQMFPTAKPYTAGGEPLALMSEEDWTDGMKQAATYAVSVAKHCVSREIEVQFANEVTWPFAATYGPGGPLTFNVGRLGYKFFEDGCSESLDSLLIHELGHEYAASHLCDEFHEALCNIGARLRRMS